METEQLQAPATKKTYKRIDMGFLSMRLPNGLPRFACLPYHVYQHGSPSIIHQQSSNDGRTPIIDITGQAMKGWMPMIELVRVGDFVTLPDGRSGRATKAGRFLRNPPWGPSTEHSKYYSAEPSSAVPSEVRATDWKAKGFDDLRVAWEATWLELETGVPVQADAPLDPILIGTRGGKDWILATWDLTKLESYVVAEFCED